MNTKVFMKETHVLDTRIFFRFLCYHKVEKGQCHDIFTPYLFRLTIPFRPSDCHAEVFSNISSILQKYLNRKYRYVSQYAYTLLSDYSFKRYQSS